MTSTVARFHQALVVMGSNIVFHRESGGTNCPCRTAEGFRDPAYHSANPEAPLCNEQGLLSVTVQHFTVKGSIQGAQTRYWRRSQQVDDLFGAIQSDDKLGIFPCVWNGNPLDFDNWSAAGEDYLLYDGHRYTVVTADKMPDTNGDPSHHWECALRRIDAERPNA